LAEDASGRLWILSRGGLSIFDGQDLSPAPPLDGISSIDIGQLAADEAGGIWIAGAQMPSRVAVFEDEAWQQLPPSEFFSRAVSSALLVRRGEGVPFVALGSTKDGLHLFQGGSWTKLDESSGLASSTVIALAGGAERLVVATGAGLQVVRDGVPEPVLRSIDSRLAEPLLALEEVQVGEETRLLILASTWLGELSLETERLEILVEDFQLSGSLVLGASMSGVIAADAFGGLYFGNYAEAFYLPGGSSEANPVGVLEGLASEGLTCAVLDREQSLWIGTIRGLSQVPSRRFLIYDQNEGLPESEVSALLELEPGKWIFGQNRSLSLFDGRTFQPFAMAAEGSGPLAATRVMDLAKTRDGSVLVAAMERGLGRLRADGLLSWLGSEEGLPPVVHSVEVANEEIWVAAGSAGIFFREAAEGRFEAVNLEGSLVSYVRWVVARPEGGVFAATQNGLLTLDRHSWAVFRTETGARAAANEKGNNVFTVLPAQSAPTLVGTGDGLYELRDQALRPFLLGGETLIRPIFALLRDSADTLWLGTDDGVFTWDGNRLRHLSVGDGLAGREVNRGALVEDGQGKVWIGTNGGASVYDAAFDTMEERPPVAEILRVEAGDEVLPKSGSVEVAFGHNDLFFEVRGVSLSKGRRLQCRYRLEGFDSGWTALPVLPRTPVRYTNLPAGHYRFYLAVGTDDGVWSDVVSSAEIRVRRPLWRTPWLQSLVILLLGLALWVSYRSYAARRHASLHDPLTGLPNRALFDRRLRSVMARWQRRGEPSYALLFLDIDRFKNVNDSLGHVVGDQLLKSIAGRLKDTVQPQDTVARLGGDEFTVLLDDLGVAESAGAVAERLLRAFEASFRLQGHEVFAGLSIGIAVGSNDYRDATEILRDADIAMYRAKDRGRGCYEFFSPEMHEVAVARLRLETELRRALEREELKLVYQPIVSLESGEVDCCEALLRWNHPRRGLLLPAAFLDMAEETGLILAIADWALDRACGQLRTWEAAGKVPSEGFCLNINLSPRQLSRLDLAERLLDITKRHGVASNRITLEITESAVMAQMRSARWVLERCRDLGFGLALDDFGTGHSSLSQLQRFPVRELKLDRAFVSEIESSPATQEIVRTVVNLGRSLNLRVIAEGVETEAQSILLQGLGCRWAQGFLFSRPVDAEFFEAVAIEKKPEEREEGKTRAGLRAGDLP